MRFSPGQLRFLLNLWPPFRGAGIRVREISADWRYARVELRENWLNTGFYRTHFGGSLYAMADPFPALQLAHLLGPDYLVWDRVARVDFLKPGRGCVYAESRIADGEVERLRSAAAGGAKLLPEYELEVLDQSREVVARIHHTVYVRLRRERRPSPATPAPGDPG